MKTPQAASTGSILAQVVEDYLEARHRGEQPNAATIIACHPEIAEELTACLASLDFLDGFVEPAQAAARTPPALGRIGGDGMPTLGDFRLIRELGRGGMGVVYEAEQISLRRRVALKVLPFAAILDERQRTRFQNESVAAASLHHPHIVPVYWVGHEQGTHFYAMQLVAGRTLAQIILQLASAVTSHRAPSAQSSPGGPLRVTDGVATDDGRDDDTLGNVLSSIATKDRGVYYRRIAEIGRQAAEALDHAHQRGIVHRDIKPSNLMLDETGKVWVMDFGLATMEAQPQLTMTGDLIGTLRYMSPEQATAQRDVLDHRTDVYSLGVTLYELLVLQPAFQAVGRIAIVHQVVNETPRRPRLMRREIPVELETIVLKAAAKSPFDRYPTAKALADDLDRFVRQQPILARPLSISALAWRWVQRHPSLSGAVSLATAGLLLAVLIIAGYATRNAALVREHAWQRQALVAESARLEQQEFYVSLAKIKERSLVRPLGWVWQNIADIQKISGGAPDEHSRQQLRGELTLALCSYDVRKCATLMEEFDSYTLAFSGDGQRLAAGSNAFVPPEPAIVMFAGTPLIPGSTFSWEIVPDPLQEANEPEGVRSLLFHPDGRRLIVGSRHGHLLLFDATTGKLQSRWKAHSHRVLDLNLYDDDHLISASQDGTVRFWRISDQACLHTEKIGSVCSRLVREGQQLFVVADELVRLKINPDRSTKPLATLPLTQGNLVLCPDERGLLAANGREMAVHDRFLGKVTRHFVDPRRERSHDRTPATLEISRDGRWVATTDSSSLRLWDFMSAQPIAKINLSGSGRAIGAFHPSAPFLAISANHRVELYEIFHSDEMQSLWPQTTPVAGVDLTPDGRSMAAATRVYDRKSITLTSDFVAFIDPARPGTGHEVRIAKDGGGPLSIDPSGQAVAMPGNRWNNVTQVGRRGLESYQYFPVYRADCVRYSPDGSLIWLTGDNAFMAAENQRRSPSALVAVTATDMREVFRWVNTESDRRLRMSALKGLAVGRQNVVAVSLDQTLRLFNVQSSAPLKEISLAPGHPQVSVLAAAEQAAIVGLLDGRLQVVDLTTGQLNTPLPVHRESVVALAASANGLVVSGGSEGEVCISRLESRDLRLLFRLSAREVPVRQLSLTADGRLLAVLWEGDGGVRLLNLDQILARQKSLGLSP